MDAQSWELTVAGVDSAFTMETVEVVRRGLADLMARPGHVILDLRGATLDSSGLSAVLAIQRRLELQGRLLLVISAEEGFLNLLERAGATDSLLLFADADQALAHARSYPARSRAA